MILVDTWIWVDHLRQTQPALSRRLERVEVLTHPFVIGELALGNVRQRDLILGLLRGLPSAIVATDDEVHAYIERHRLSGLGIGYVDAHLLAATALTARARLWTRDRRLAVAAAQVGLDAQVDH